MKITDIGPWTPGANVTALLAEAIANACATSTKDKLIAIPSIDDVTAGLPLVDVSNNNTGVIQFTAPGVTIVGAGPNSGVQINPASVTGLTGNYAVFNTNGQPSTRFANFQIDGQAVAIKASLIALLTPSLGATAATTAVNNCGMGFALIYCGASSGSLIPDCAIIDMTLHDVFNGIGESFAAVLAGSLRGRVQRCHIYNVTGSGIQAAGNSTTSYTCDANLIADNFIENCSWMSITDFVARRTKIHRNTCRSAGKRNIDLEFTLGSSVRGNDCDISQTANVGTYGQCIDVEIEGNILSNANQANFGIGEIDLELGTLSSVASTVGTVRIGPNTLMPIAGNPHITISERSAVGIGDSCAAQVVISDPNADQYLICCANSSPSGTNWKPNSVWFTGQRIDRPANLGLLSAYNASNGTNSVALGGDLAPTHARRFTATAGQLAIFTPSANYAVQAGQWVKVSYSVSAVDNNVNWLIGFPASGGAQAVRVPNLSTDLLPVYFSGSFYFHVADGGSAVPFQVWNEATSTNPSILVVGALLIETVPAPAPALVYPGLATALNTAVALGFPSENPN